MIIILSYFLNYPLHADWNHKRQSDDIKLAFPALG